MTIQKKIADSRAMLLSIDDGPNPETTPLLLDVLKHYGAKAAFFVCGHKVEKSPWLAEAIVAQGHGLFSHGYDHRDLSVLSDEALIEQLDKTEALLKRCRPTPSPYPFRFPFGKGFNSKRVRDTVRRWRDDVLFAQWSLTPKEWRQVSRCKLPSDVDRVSMKTVQRLAESEWGGEILLLHDWPVDVPGEAPFPERLEVRPYFCAALLEKILVEATARRLRVQPPASGYFFT